MIIVWLSREPIWFTGLIQNDLSAEKWVIMCLSEQLAEQETEQVKGKLVSEAAATLEAYCDAGPHAVAEDIVELIASRLGSSGE